MCGGVFFVSCSCVGDPSSPFPADLKAERVAPPHVGGCLSVRGSLGTDLRILVCEYTLFFRRFSPLWGRVPGVPFPLC